MDKGEYQAIADIEKLLGNIPMDVELTHEQIDKLLEDIDYYIPNDDGHVQAVNQLTALEDYCGGKRAMPRKTEKLPDSIRHLRYVWQFHLDGMGLTSIPDSIGEMKMLYRVDLSSNKITSIPESIGDLPRIHQLDLGSNHLTSIPESIGNLKSLIALNLVSNSLNSLPESI